MVGLIGWTSSALLAACGIPLAYDAYNKGEANGVPAPFLWMWYVGEWLALFYVLLQHGLDGPLLANYGFNILLISVVLRYKYWPRLQIDKNNIK
jgi:hypothetical protein